MDKYDQFFEKLKTSTPSNYGTEPTSVELFHSLFDGQVPVATTHVYPTKLLLAMCILFMENYAAYTGSLIPDMDHDFFSMIPIMIYAEDEESIDRTLVWSNGSIQYTKEDHIVLWLTEEIIDIIRPKEKVPDA